MGMFDRIKIEMKLPGYSEVTDDEFQTKDFDCLLEKYVITANGELYREEWDYEWVEDENQFLGGRERKIPESYRREYLTNFYGDINFYNGKVNDVWRDYYATFKDGKVVSIRYEDKQY